MPGTVKQETYQPIQFDAIQIGLASPEKIREWSRGEVKKPDPAGKFCESSCIFAFTPLETSSELLPGC